MTRTVIVYGTTTGSTEMLAEKINETCKEHKLNADLVNVTNISPSNLTDYDLIFLGCSTWGEGELQEDFIPFEERMKKINLTGKQAACFGPGDSSFTLFCEAVDILENRLESCGAKIITESLKVDGDVGSQLDEAGKWAEKVIEASSQN